MQGSTIMIVFFALIMSAFVFSSYQKPLAFATSALAKSFSPSRKMSLPNLSARVHQMKAKFGAIVVDGRGKIGGHVASKNRAGSYFRTKVTPVNPQTDSQVEARNRLAGISSSWRGLTGAQRAAWNSSVADFAKTDIFGDLRNPTGFNLYQKLNNNLLNIGQSVILVPPAASAVDAFVSFGLTVEDATVAELVELTYDPAIAADHSVKVFATPPLSAGVSFVKSEYRQIDVMLTADSSPFDITVEYVAKFGSTGAAGQKVFVKLVQVRNDSGIEGVALSHDAIVEASS